jgi:NAD(P)-dependent dehydrogenase (short-subunit alcohol dehydrogenase family)
MTLPERKEDEHGKATGGPCRTLIGRLDVLVNNAGITG